MLSISPDLSLGANRYGFIEVKELLSGTSQMEESK